MNVTRRQLIAPDAVQAAVFSRRPCSSLSVTAMCSNTFLLFVELPQSLHRIAAWDDPNFCCKVSQCGVCRVLWEAIMTSQSTDHHI